VVDGTGTPDQWLVSRANRRIRQETIAHKEARLVLTRHGDRVESEVEDVPDKLRDVPCLTHGQAVRLTEMALTLERHYQYPQDMEWAVDEDDQIVLLQTRPMGLDSPVQEGYLRISRNLTEEEWAAGKSGWGVVYGLAKPNGEIVIEPQYDYLYPPQDGCVVIMQDYRLGHIDLETGMTVEPRFEFITDSLPCYTFSNGYALLYPLQVGEQEWVQLLIDRQGREIFSTYEEDEIRLESPVFTPGGLCVYEKNHRYGLMKIHESQAIVLTEPLYEKINYWNSWHEMKHPLESGWLPVKMDGLWGYMNEQAEMIIPPQWEEADIFRQGLARVEKNGKMAYINLQGDIIWQEP